MIIVNKMEKKKRKIFFPIYTYIRMYILYIYKGKDGYIWQVNPKRSGRIPLHNIVLEKPGPKK